MHSQAGRDADMRVHLQPNCDNKISNIPPAAAAAAAGPSAMHRRTELETKWRLILPKIESSRREMIALGKRRQTSTNFRISHPLKRRVESVLNTRHVAPGGVAAWRGKGRRREGCVRCVSVAAVKTVSQYYSVSELTFLSSYNKWGRLANFGIGCHISAFCGEKLVEVNHQSSECVQLSGWMSHPPLLGVKFDENLLSMR